VEATQASAPPLGFKANKNLRKKRIYLTLIKLNYVQCLKTQNKGNN
jgi:hypothetical protein